MDLLQITHRRRDCIPYLYNNQTYSACPSFHLEVSWQVYSICLPFIKSSPFIFQFQHSHRFIHKCLGRSTVSAFIQQIITVPSLVYSSYGFACLSWAPKGVYAVTRHAFDKWCQPLTQIRHWPLDTRALGIGPQSSFTALLCMSGSRPCSVAPLESAFRVAKMFQPHRTGLGRLAFAFIGIRERQGLNNPQS